MALGRNLLTIDGANDEIDFLLTKAGAVNAATPEDEEEDKVTTKAAARAVALNFITGIRTQGE